MRFVNILRLSICDDPLSCLTQNRGFSTVCEPPGQTAWGLAILRRILYHDVGATIRLAVCPPCFIRGCFLPPLERGWSR